MDKLRASDKISLWSPVGVIATFGFSLVLALLMIHFIGWLGSNKNIRKICLVWKVYKTKFCTGNTYNDFCTKNLLKSIYGFNPIILDLNFATTHLFEN